MVKEAKKTFEEVEESLEAHERNELKRYAETLKLTGELLNVASNYVGDPVADKANGEGALVKTAIKTSFEDKIWFDGGLREQIIDSPAEGLSLKDHDFQALSFKMKGTVILTLINIKKETQMTLCIDETDQKCGEQKMELHGISATRVEAMGLLNRLGRLHRQGKKFSPDPRVSIR